MGVVPSVVMANWMRWLPGAAPARLFQVGAGGGLVEGGAQRRPPVDVAVIEQLGHGGYVVVMPFAQDQPRSGQVDGSGGARRRRRRSS